MHSCLVRIDNIHKRRLQARASDQKAIDIRLLSQLIAVLLRHASSVKDARLVRRLARHLFLKPLTQRSMDLLRLFGSSHFARSNGPVYTSASLSLTHYNGGRKHTRLVRMQRQSWTSP
jgi:hypothetical protein